MEEVLLSSARLSMEQVSSLFLIKGALFFSILLICYALGGKCLVIMYCTSNFVKFGAVKFLSLLKLSDKIEAILLYTLEYITRIYPNDSNKWHYLLVSACI